MGAPFLRWRRFERVLIEVAGKDGPKPTFRFELAFAPGSELPWNVKILFIIPCDLGEFVVRAPKR
jgi:hypothetical protein